MSGPHSRNICQRSPRYVAGAFAILSWFAGWVTGQTVPEPMPAAGTTTGVAQAEDGTITDPQVQPASCGTCGSGLLGGPSADLGGCSGCGNQCVPGRLNCCSSCESSHCFGRMICGFYDCICCPDPCYEPRWIGAANAALFQDQARPVTQARVRWDHGQNGQFPDRAEYFWARADGNGKGPRPTPPFRGETGFNYDNLSVYTEGAIERFSFFLELPYRSVDANLAGKRGGFSDMNIGTKSLLLDCELLQFSFQFRSYFPTGNFAKGLGNGHTTLEPSILMSLKLTPDMYFQGQVAQMIPLGGDPAYAGGVLHYHTSINQVLWRLLPDVELIGTGEFNAWSWQAGMYTDPVLGPQPTAGTSWLTLGPGVRLVMCNRLDFGFGAAYAFGTESFLVNQLYRTELRYRF